MSDSNIWNDREPANDPFAPDTVEASIIRSLRPDAPATPTKALVHALADSYALPPAADAALARGRATLARRAQEVGAGQHTGGYTMLATDTWPAPSRSGARPPKPPRRPHRPIVTLLRAVAAVVVVALLGASFYSLLHGLQSRGAKPQLTPAATQQLATATPDTPTLTPVSPQPPAPAGVYVSTPGMLFRLDPSTGAIQKRYPVPSSGQAQVGAPVVVDGIVAFTELDPSDPASVVGISASSGDQIWRTLTVGRLAQLVVVGGTIYGGTEGTGTGSDTFYALRASDGAVLWNFHTATLRPPAVVTGGVVYLVDQPQGASLQHLHALRASDGAQLWETTLPQTCASESDEAVDQGMIFVACVAQGDMGQGGDGSVYGLRESNGAILWHVTTNGEPNDGLAAGAGLVYISVAGKNAAGVSASGLYAFDGTSGAGRWQERNGDGWPIFDGGAVYAELGSDLAAFSASSGAVLWTYPLANQRIEMNPPALAGGVVYDILNEQVVAISTANGSVLWRSPALASQQQGLAGLSVVTGA